MSYLEDIIHALKGVAAPFLLIATGAMFFSGEGAPFGDTAGLALFTIGIAWVVYLSFFAED